MSDSHNRLPPNDRDRDHNRDHDKGVEERSRHTPLDRRDAHRDRNRCESDYGRDDRRDRNGDSDGRGRYERRDNHGSRSDYDRRGRYDGRDSHDRRDSGYSRCDRGYERRRDDRYERRHDDPGKRDVCDDHVSRDNRDVRDNLDNDGGRLREPPTTAHDDRAAENTAPADAPATTNADATDASAETAEELPVPTDLESFESFEDMKLDENLFRGILAHGFEKPSMIQQKAIPAFLKYKNDIIAQAQSGTGKTATFSVSLLQMIDDASDKPQGVILAPTRELATQIHSVITSIGQFTKKRVALVSGGGNVRDCVDRLRRDRPHVIVATPGRMKHLLRDQLVDCRYLRYLILDEADEMLSEGFQDDVRDIVSYVPETVRIGLYSATMPAEMDSIAKQFMRNPIEIRVKEAELTLEGIRQYKIVLEDGRHKFACIMDLFSDMSIYQMMIYCNSKRSVDNLKYDLDHERIPCEAIHGQMMTGERNEIMKRFRGGDVRVLVTTDLTARGIDVQQVSLVINYDFPQDIATYLHRIGRGGRFGRKGYAINMVVDDRMHGGYDRDRDRRRRVNDMENLRRVTEYYHTYIDDMPEDVKQAFAA